MFESGDQVVVFAVNKEIAVESFPEPIIKDNGQQIILKVHPKGGSFVINGNDSINIGAIGLESGNSVTLLGSVALKQWLVVGRS